MTEEKTGAEISRCANLIGATGACSRLSVVNEDDREYARPHAWEPLTKRRRSKGRRNASILCPRRVASFEAGQGTLDLTESRSGKCGVEYARSALKNGIKMEAARCILQVRHRRRTDAHTVDGLEEDNFFGKPHPPNEPDARESFMKTTSRIWLGEDRSAMPRYGDRTRARQFRREMKRRETYATRARHIVRFFVGGTSSLPRKQ